MKIAISYPPLDSAKGSPFLSQNRQFQWTNTGNIIYPIVPAYAATWLTKLGHQILWDDAIAQKLNCQSWFKRLINFRPDLIVIESKTPVIKRHWQIIKKLKAKSLEIRNWKLEIVLIGDHVTALPKESLLNSPVDYVATGGDYDFMIKNLVDHLTKKTKLEAGFYYRKDDKIINTGKFSLKHHNLDILPFIDRQLTCWQDYSKNNTNYKYLPGTYTMFGRDCWWGKCTFCSWTTTHPFGTFRTFSVKRALDEVGHIINTTNVKEIFDDTGTFPVGKWLIDFCQGLIDRGYSKKVVFGCNMRFGALTQDQYHLMKKANFRFVLYGLESNNQKTLDLIDKNTKVKQARLTLQMAKTAGLEPHLTIMIGYPWETKADAVNTLNEGRQLFRDGLADTMQATRIIPYPGTPLFAQCQKNQWLLTKDWDKYDMRQAVMKSPLTNTEQDKLIQSLFAGVLTPKFLIRKILSIRSISDIIFLARYAIKYLQKIRDFG
jgi:radical SAM superfamily enzyme YgiQ (UPF0313 family)